MKQTLTIDDLNLVAGRFIIQLNTESPIKLNDRGVDIEFYIEKRIRLISYGGKGVIESDLYGNTLSYTKEDFIEKFNNYLGDSKGTRYHRLLYSAELEVVFNWMKKRNY